MDVRSVNKPVVHATPPPKRPEQARPSPENKPHTNEVHKAEQAPNKPVVNTQGNVTGRHLNVTA